MSGRHESSYWSTDKLEISLFFVWHRTAFGFHGYRFVVAAVCDYSGYFSGNTKPKSEIISLLSGNRLLMKAHFRVCDDTAQHLCITFYSNNYYNVNKL